VATMNEVGSIDQNIKIEALKWYDKPKDKQLSQPNNHGDEVEDCCI